MVKSIKLYPGLAAAAIKAGRRREIMLWSQLRALNVTGSGRIRLEAGLAQLEADYGYSRPTLYRILREGAGLFWEVRHQDPALIILAGLGALAEALQAPRIGGPVIVPVEDLQTLRARNAWLYASHFGPSWAKNRPISRQSLQDATGVQPRTQRRYDKITRTRKTANFAVIERAGVLVPVTQEIWTKGQALTKHKRLGNSYHSQADGAPRGLAHRIQASLRLRSCYEGEATEPLRRYYVSARALVKGRGTHQAEFPLYLVPEAKRTIPGRVEWCYA